MGCSQGRCASYAQQIAFSSLLLLSTPGLRIRYSTRAWVSISCRAFNNLKVYGDYGWRFHIIQFLGQSTILLFSLLVI